MSHKYKIPEYTEMLLSNELKSYLLDIEDECKDKLELLIKQMAEKEKVNEELKANNQLEWVARMNNIITQNSTEKLIKNIENEKEIFKSKMNKLIDLSIENAIDRETFLERKEKIQNKINQLNLEQEKLILEEENKQSKEISLNKLKKYVENGKIITEFDKDAFEILVKQVIVGGYDEKKIQILNQ